MALGARSRGTSTRPVAFSDGPAMGVRTVIYFIAGLVLLAVTFEWLQATRLPSSWSAFITVKPLLPVPQPYGPYSEYCPLQKVGSSAKRCTSLVFILLWEWPQYEPMPGCHVNQVNIIQRHGQSKHQTDTVRS